MKELKSAMKPPDFHVNSFSEIHKPLLPDFPCLLEHGPNRSWLLRWAMRAPCTGSYSQAVSVHEHGWSEPAKTIPGEVEEPVDGERTHDPRNETYCSLLPRLLT